MSMSVLLGFITLGSYVSTELNYVITENYLADPEPYNDWTEPADEKVWKSYIVDAQNLGLTFAGKTEFSWVVDLRVDNTEPENWSTGNLLTTVGVLTTCKAATKLRDLHQNVGSARATYAQLYLWEYLEKDNYLIQNWPYGGTRRVRYFDLHFRCDVRRLEGDIAVLELENPVNLIPPFTGPMPVVVQPGRVDQILDVDLGEVLRERRLCFVGSIGRAYTNWAFHLVQDFKTRYRVYNEPWRNCTRMISKICDNREHDCDFIFDEKRAIEKGWTCFRSRARVGTVCDHDRGAPLVCDDEVVGLVVLGAQFKYCNDRLPMPFVVAKMKSFQWFLNKYALNRRFRNH